MVVLCELYSQCTLVWFIQYKLNEPVSIYLRLLSLSIHYPHLDVDR